MLKLLKHDLKRNWEFFITFGVIIFVSIILIPFFLGMNDNGVNLDAFNLLFLIFAIVILTVAICMFLNRSFGIIHQTLFQREAYLTFTLPYSIHKIILSKCLSIIIWSLFIFACFDLGVTLALWESSVLLDTKFSFSLTFGLEFDSITILSLVHAFFSFFLFIAIYLFSCSFVNTKFVKSRKRTWATSIIVLCFFVISLFYTIINQLFGIEQYSSYYPSVLSVVISLIFTIGCTVGLYFLSYYILTKKYELE